MSPRIEREDWQAQVDSSLKVNPFRNDIALATLSQEQFTSFAREHLMGGDSLGLRDALDGPVQFLSTCFHSQDAVLRQGVITSTRDLLDESSTRVTAGDTFDESDREGLYNLAVLSAIVGSGCPKEDYADIKEKVSYLANNWPDAGMDDSEEAAIAGILVGAQVSLLRKGEDSTKWMGLWSDTQRPDWWNMGFMGLTAVDTSLAVAQLPELIVRIDTLVNDDFDPREILWDLMCAYDNTAEGLLKLQADVRNITRPTLLNGILYDPSKHKELYDRVYSYIQKLEEIEPVVPLDFKE